MQLQERFLAFTVAGEQYAVALVNVREVIADSDVTPVPFTPEFMTGILNLRGQVISVIDLKKRFNLQSSDKSVESSILILECNACFLGIKVDSVDCVVQLKQEQLSSPPTHSGENLMRFVEGVYRSERQFIVILNSENLFSFDENPTPRVGLPSNAVA